MKRILFFFFALFFALVTSSLIHAETRINHQENRGVWLTNIDSTVLFSPEETAIAINTLADLNFNTVYPTVWNWGYTLYPSQVAEKVIKSKIDPTEGLQNRDVLAEIIKQAHQRQISVIPWFEFGFMAPADSQLAQLHPDWLVQREDGSTIWLEGNVHERVWLNPLHPEVQDFISDLIMEIVSNYDVEGIQVDDHFGYPAEFGYDPYTVALYRQQHQDKSPPLDHTNPEWIQWRADQITAYVETLFHRIKAVKPNLIISVSPNPQTFSLEEYLLDWAKWEKKGLIEELIVQVYRNNMEDFNRELSQAELQQAKNHIPTSIGILTGLKGNPIDFALITEQIEQTRQQQFAGISFFFYESLWNFGPERPQQRQFLLKSLFKRPTNRIRV
jgi:uncharacterized lipoprotein YddW (UPF0748 family)